ncbi:MAG: MFS transporter [Chloroflexota bacterium]
MILLGGLGSAAFHPALASLARTIGGRRGEVAVGLFSAGGTLGIALGPVIIMMLFARYGLSYTPWLMLPGIFFGLLILMLTTETSETIKAESSKLFDSRLILGPVGLLALTSILSNVAFVTFTSAMPLWLVRTHNLPRRIKPNR